MKYPKAVMRKTELEKMGFPEQWLLMVFRKHGQKVAWKMGNYCRKGGWLNDKYTTS